MSEFTIANWKDALFKVYVRSTRDPQYRLLCVADPIAAIKEVSDIELPPGLKVHYFEYADEYDYTFLLPPAVKTDAVGQTEVEKLVAWEVYCTDMTGTH